MINRILVDRVMRSSVQGGDGPGPQLRGGRGGGRVKRFERKSVDGVYGPPSRHGAVTVSA